MKEKRKFIVFSEFGETLDVAVALKDEGNEVLFHVQTKDYSAIGKGMVEITTDWWNQIGQSYIWIFDGNNNGCFQDWLRKRGELVFGSSKKSDMLENNRQAQQQLFRAAGFKQPESKEFHDFDSAIEYVKKSEGRLIMKQNGDCPKSLNHMGKFEDGSDMIFHLEEMKKKWAPEFGEVNFDLMGVVEGMEMAVSVFFNGKNFMKEKNGEIAAFVNFEHKKEIDGDLGETTGELGTLFTGTDGKNPVVKDILRPEILNALRATEHRGCFDINGTKTKDGFVCFEVCDRLGIPAASYELIEGLDMPLSDLIYAVANGNDTPVSIKKGVGMVMVVAAKPFPIDTDLPKECTSMGEKLWILKDGKPINDFTDEQKKHIHLQNFEKTDDGYKVATKNGYLLTVTAKGKTIKETRENLIQYIKDNIYISGQKWRSDIGKRVEEYGRN